MSKKKRYPLRIPRFAAGIRLQGARSGGIADWWTKRWAAALERMNVAGRLSRARNYAMSGQVTALAISGPHVEATVVGKRDEPYRVTIDFRHPEGEAREKIVSALRSEPMLVARMLARDLPTEVEGIFRNAGFDLFPGGKLGEGKYDVTTGCTCPDYANPCKHSDTVLLLLGEEIARRPMTLVELRGIPEEELYEN